MSVENIMKKYNFAESSSGGDCLWYTKQTKYEGDDAFIAITVEDGCGIPETLDEPILVSGSSLPLTALDRGQTQYCSARCLIRSMLRNYSSRLSNRDLSVLR
ncbi:MAG: hypothetical protein ACE5GU_11025 [Candidatus Scalinduaceae bacterium]